jgi:sulfur-oxidizing protein SoxX
MRICGVRNAAVAAALLLAAPACAQGLVAQGLAVAGIDAPLTAEPGDAARGRAIVTDRRKGLCLLCHSGPFPEERFQGDLAPSLAGAGTRNSVAQLRARIVDSRKVAPGSLMPAYFASDGLARVAPQYAGRTILTAGEVEDVVAFLATLKE